MDDGLTRKLRWRVARVVDSTPETESARTIALAVPGWGGHLAGQHIDLKLTAEDGYCAQRSYSLSRTSDGELIELTLQQIVEGEVSPYLMGVCPGEEIELRGPIGG
ncbi:ferredoxin-NADP reductase [Mycobacterium sp. URHB0021]